MNNSLKEEERKFAKQKTNTFSNSISNFSTTSIFLIKKIYNEKNSWRLWDF
jgi:hypothetical protein